MSMTTTSPTGPISFALNEPDWAYLHVQLLHDTPPTEMDLISWRLIINTAMGKFLGITGESIPVDILKIYNEASQCWIRVPESDLTSTWTALSGATCSVNISGTAMVVGLRVIRASRHLMGILGDQRGEEFSS